MSIGASLLRFGHTGSPVFNCSATREANDVDGSAVDLFAGRPSTMPPETRNHPVILSDQILDADPKIRKRGASGCYNLAEPSAPFSAIP